MSETPVHDPDAGVPTIDPVVDTSIYPMPMFLRLEVSDLARSRAFYTGALDMVELAVLPPSGPPFLVHLRRWRYQDLLLVPARGPVSAAVGLGLSLAAEHDALAGLAERATAFGAPVEGPVDTPWNTTDVTVTDPDGLRITYTARRPAERRDADFEAVVRSSVAARD
ncbi:VOC family protein [Pseudonocardia humida]|uniref:VOC family protein n=1 Tax=Pseudonocardia humida TaxID=2800819 RepID=A0ABT0ZUR2_9PSEU|nr:VOC family protein [Pseudonocardia humida]MCO1654465.1 VOC family protein [Pseudonocardia humida]